jgi:Ca2+-binding EF-hand superfamily protein
MHSTLRLVLVGLLGASFAAVAVAQEPTEQGQPPTANPFENFLGQHDTDGDGKVSLAEVVAPQEERFKETDTNADGFVSLEEIRQSFSARVPPEAQQKLKERGLPDPSEAIIQELDKNGDGKADLGEFKQPTVEGFKHMDADGDGFATSDEVEAFFNEMRERLRQMRQKGEKQPAQ